MKLQENYYHCFLGNGLDAVLIGYNGSMVSDKVGVDRCAWYKSDRYYPEDKLVMVAGRFPVDKTLEHAEGSGWYDVAPLGRTWYEVSSNDRQLKIESSNQLFLPKEGVLYTDLDFGKVKAKVTTFLSALGSLLVEHYEFSQEVEFTAWMAPGVWFDDGWDTDPFYSVEMDAESTRGTYDLGETNGKFFMQLEPQPFSKSNNDNDCGLTSRGKTFTKYFSILDNRQGKLTEEEFLNLVSPGYQTILNAHLNFWKNHFSASDVSIPDTQFQYFYDASQYHFKAIQNPISGGLPVNNLRRTWSSHIFWDSYFIQHAILESNHVAESLEGVRFFEVTKDKARQHAKDEFGCNGLKWDWEVTHDGRKAYGTLLHMKFQVHNNGSYSNMIWQHYQYTKDRKYLERFFPILEGLATFFMDGIVIHTDRGWEIGPLVGVHESPIKVKNEGTNLAATIVILEHYADAARLLKKETELSQKCHEVATGLRKTLDLLFNGRFFVSAEGLDNWNMSSMAVIYPMQIISSSDPRASTTAVEIIKQMDEPPVHNGHKWESAWSAGVDATILALQGLGNDAWKELQLSRTSICQFGGMTEVRIDNEWNMQYFCTAQAAVMTAFHAMLLQGNDTALKIFPAIPSEWKSCSYNRLLNFGLEVNAKLENSNISGLVKNISSETIERDLHFADNVIKIKLNPQETYAF